jgi:signal transduction histidine kinase
VFYDYDELCLVTECRFRDLPTPSDDDEETAGEAWFYVGENDIFPEEFLKFLGLPERLRDAFVAAVSHELRTPLTSISGFVEMLGDEERGLSPAGRNYVKVISRGTARLQRIVEDLLLVAEIEADRLQLTKTPTDLGELAAATVEASLPAAAEQEIELVLDVEGPLPLEADAARLGQVLDNLVSNALKYTRPGGMVVVSATESDGSLRVEVADNGIGVPHDELGQLFSRFYRASTATRLAIPGTGLGLVIVRAIVERHGGTVSLSSVEGEGTRVIVSLPAGQSDGGT